ncbi:hypothetical protein HDU93_005754 [Gonapodya sp. JEL0774]|nr:hypothetical protein HDU93_005754 [Gonapodya sp. JEL0774]
MSATAAAAEPHFPSPSLPPQTVNITYSIGSQYIGGNARAQVGPSFYNNSRQAEPLKAPQARSNVLRGRVEGTSAGSVQSLLEAIEPILDALPAPGLEAAYSDLRGIVNSAAGFKENKELADRLAHRCALVVRTLQERAQQERGFHGTLGIYEKQLRTFLTETANFLQGVGCKSNQLKVISHATIKKDILDLDARLEQLCSDFQFATILNVQKWAAENEEDARTAQRAIDESLRHVAESLERMQCSQKELLQLILAVQTRLEDINVPPGEKQILTQVQKECKRRSDNPATRMDWYIEERHIVVAKVMKEGRENELWVGGGTYGDVFRGLWRGGTTVAVKRVRIKELNENSIKAAQYEIEVWWILRHPNILPLYGANLTCPQPFMVSPFMEHGHVIKYLGAKPDGGSVYEKTMLILDIAKGMEYLHSLDIIHRDLKGNNVLVDAQGTGIVADFGFAKVSNVVRSQSLGGSSGNVGTKRWKAPELFQKGGKNSKSTDVYAFAMTCCEIWTLDIPLPDVDEDVLGDKVKDGERPDIDRFADIKRPVRPIPLMPDYMKDLLKRCWDATPENRPPFTAAVEHLQKHLPRLPATQPPLRPELLSKLDSGVALSAPLARLPSSSSGSRGHDAVFEALIPRLKFPGNYDISFPLTIATSNARGVWMSSSLAFEPPPGVSSLLDVADLWAHCVLSREEIVNPWSYVLPFALDHLKSKWVNNTHNAPNFEDLTIRGMLFNPLPLGRARFDKTMEYAKSLANKNRMKRWPAMKFLWHGTTAACSISDLSVGRSIPACIKDEECRTCGILRNGFSMAVPTTTIKWGRFGMGIYTAEDSSNAHNYTSQAGDHALILCLVVVGESYRAEQDMPNLSMPPNGKDSVYGVTKKEAPNSKSKLTFSETVVYMTSAVFPIAAVRYTSR